MIICAGIGLFGGLFFSSEGTLAEKMCARKEVFLLLILKTKYFLHYLPIKQNKTTKMKTKINLCTLRIINVANRGSSPAVQVDCEGG